MENMFKEHFCMAPWVHMSVWQTGDTYPCCIYDWNSPVGNINENGLKGVWNSEKMRELRNNMLDNVPAAGCKKCFDYDKQGILSYRHKMNTEYNHHYDLVQTTQADGTVEKLNLPYFDIRFSNLCNMKCRSCGPHFSSKWAEDTDGKPKVIEIDYPNLWNEINEVIPTVEEIYFTGGESLFMSQHYDMLDLLIENNLKPKLTYNSNASRLSLKNRHVKDYWKNFDSIFFCVSFDQIGEKANYTRHGQKWDTVYQNLCWIRDNTPHVYIQPNPTISVLNVLDIASMTKFLYDNRLTTDYDMNLNNLLTGPEYLSATILPKHLKDLAKDRIKQFCKELENYDMFKERREFLTTGFDNIINFMYYKDDTHLIPKFKAKMIHLDKIRNESFINVFPELKELYD